MIISIVEMVLFIAMATICLSAPYWIPVAYRYLKEKYPAKIEKITWFSCLLSFFLMIIFYGVMMTAMGGWFVVMPFIPILVGFPMWYFFYKLLQSKWWTAVYIVFSLCSLKWVLYLNNGWDESSSASMKGLVFFIIAALCFLWIALALRKNPFSTLFAIITMIVCVVLTITVIRFDVFCPEEKPIFAKGQCYSCLSNRALEVDAVSCAKCSGLRAMISGKCVLAQ